ncbi:hypothetical protein AALO_G00090820 [Alosa alosa]|uniref:Uncharacterized protein n=1 Tax=Alosa alosa TaxID=278164 RepID=A0AAV6GSA3_9TELE|nr:hypothetical protein AALO_G00090820 [Alosa alosa]
MQCWWSGEVFTDVHPRNLVLLALSTTAPSMGQEEGLNMAPILSSEMDQFPTDPMSQAHLWKVSVVLQDCCRPLGGQGKDEENNRDKEQPGAGKDKADIK